MKIKSFLQHNWALLFAAASIVIGCKVRDHFFYPKSSETINPISGKYDQTLESLLLGQVTYSGPAVKINLGDRAGGLGSDDDNKFCLFVLSPVLMLNPNAKRFVVDWDYVSSMQSSRQIMYDRVSRTLSESYEDGSHDADGTRIVATGVNDRTIHRAAHDYAPYQSLKNQ